MPEQITNSWWFYILLGIVAGVGSSSLGIGSGTIVVPALVLLCGIGQKSAQGISLAVMVPMALVGAIRYWQYPQIDMKITVITLIVCGALFGALLGVELAIRLPATLLRNIFAIFLVLVALKMFSTPATTEARPTTDRSQTNTINSENINNDR